MKKRHVLEITGCRLLIDALERPRRRKRARRVVKKKIAFEKPIDDWIKIF